LEQALRLLAQLQQPVTLLSRHPSHGTIARQLQQREGFELEVIVEPPPQEGPLLALTRLMAHHRGQRLLLAPVDMPWLQPGTLKQLLKAGAAEPERILWPTTASGFSPCSVSTPPATPPVSPPKRSPAKEAAACCAG